MTKSKTPARSELFGLGDQHPAILQREAILDAAGAGTDTADHDDGSTADTSADITLGRDEKAPDAPLGHEVPADAPEEADDQPEAAEDSKAAKRRK